MDFPEASHNRYRQSMDNNSKQSNVDKSISIASIETLTQEMRVLSIGSALVGKSLKYLGEAQIRSIANWSLRKSDLPSHTFVIVCGRELTKKGL